MTVSRSRLIVLLGLSFSRPFVGRSFVGRSFDGRRTRRLVERLFAGRSCIGRSFVDRFFVDLSLVGPPSRVIMLQIAYLSSGTQGLQLYGTMIIDLWPLYIKPLVTRHLPGHLGHIGCLHRRRSLRRGRRSLRRGDPVRRRFAATRFGTRWWHRAVVEAMPLSTLPGAPRRRLSVAEKPML